MYLDSSCAVARICAVIDPVYSDGLLHLAALAWVTGLGILLAVGLLAGPPVAAAAIGQLVAAAAVLGAMVFARRIG